MTTQLTRIEREAKDLCYDILNHDWGVEILPINEVRAGAGKAGYISGATAELNRAAPVVKALEERLAEWQVNFTAEVEAAAYFNNNTDGVGQTIPYMTYPEIPEWVKEAKQILETYKNDNHENRY